NPSRTASTSMIRPETVVLGTPKNGAPSIFGVFSYRYDEALVPGLVENISPFVHGYVSIDDRGTSAPISDEPTRRAALLSAAKAAGATWIVALDPDERLESSFVDRISDFVLQPPTCWNFNLRELFTEDSWRCDGLWGKKRVMRLFPLLPNHTP